MKTAVPHAAGQALRGIVPERVVFSTELDPYLPLGALSAYAGISKRQLWNLITRPANPLPHYRVGGRVLVRRSDYDAWAAQHRQVGVHVEEKVRRLQERQRRAHGQARS